MTEQQPDPTPTVTMSAEDFDAAIDEAVERGRASAKPSDAEAPRFAVYDTTYQRFVGDVVDTKAKAKQIAKDNGLSADQHDVREV